MYTYMCTCQQANKKVDQLVHILCVFLSTKKLNKWPHKNPIGTAQNTTYDYNYDVYKLAYNLIMTYFSFPLVLCSSI